VAPEPAPVYCDGAPKATFTAGDAPTLTLDLPATDATTIDVALVPGGGDTWHVGFTTASAVVAYGVPAAAPPATAPPRPASSPSPGFVTPAPGAPVALPPMTVAPAAPGGIVADEAQAATPQAVTGVPVGGTSGFRYSAVFGLPLALLVVGALLGDGLTRPVRLREDAA
jgi:hypothetical protein